MFGRVIKGLGVVRSIEYVDIEVDGYSFFDIVIEDCGEIFEGVDYGVVNFFKDGDIYFDWLFDFDIKLDDFFWWVIVVEGIKVFGNEKFKVFDEIIVDV